MDAPGAFEAIPDYIEGFESAQDSPKVADLPLDDQPRERAERYGMSSLGIPDLFALVLRTGVRGYPVTELCRDMMKMCDNKLLLLERKSRQELQMLKGLGPLKAMQVEAVMEIVRRYCREQVADLRKISGPDTIYSIMRPEIANLDHEEIWVMLLNRANQVLGKMRITEGSATASVFDLKKIVRAALLARAEGIIMAHNHPSGNLKPSPQDDNITRKLKEACKALDLNFLDHLIITTAGYWSYRDNSPIMR